LKHSVCLLLLLFAAGSVAAQSYTRGVGVYPGLPAQYDGPVFNLDSSAERNLALHRPAYQSSAYDYNLTAQLVTDGLRASEMPRWTVVRSSNAGEVSKAEREFLVDGNLATAIRVSGDHPWIEYDLEGAPAAPVVDQMRLWLRTIEAPPPEGGWSIVVSGSNDGLNWTEVGRHHGTEFHGKREDDLSFAVSIALPSAASFRRYRFAFAGAQVPAWELAQVDFYRSGQEIWPSGSKSFGSAWMSASGGNEWVSVDLGAACTVHRVLLDWLDRPSQAILQSSLDGKIWSDVELLEHHRNQAANSLKDELAFAAPIKARWLRVYMMKPSEAGHRYVLTELEAYGTGGPLVQPQPQPAVRAGEALRLTRGNWRVERASEVQAAGSALATLGFDDSRWLPATVPGTILTSYLNAEAIANPDFADNQMAVSDSFFTADFWLRNQFIAPALAHKDGRLWLHFKGIDWKAEIYLNGSLVGRMEGAYARREFDVTSLVRPGEQNALAVRILANDHPGGTKDKSGEWMNGGAPGHDAPTFHATVGWDWMSTIRGRDAGIWNDVTMTESGPVRVTDPSVTSRLPLPATSSADLTLAATLANTEDHAVNGKLHVEFGSIVVEEPVRLAAHETRTVQLDPAHFHALHLLNPKLWWPNGYGEANLYPVKMRFLAGTTTSDELNFQAGIRQFAYSEENNALRLWINGRRFIPRGGNWGFAESMLRYRQREYDVAMRLHRDQNFNMVRNWVGQIPDDAFYDAADRNGLVVWQDFWLANPWDGPEPDDEKLFLTSARAFVLRLRNHSSMALYCGRNEGYPPASLDGPLHKLVQELAPMEHYISSSADGPVEGRGPYRAMALKDYFAQAPAKLHSEIGSPNVPEASTLARTLSSLDLWPLAREWRLHDFDLGGGYAQQLYQSFGPVKDAAEFASDAEFVDANAYRGMFEAQSRNRQGVLIWMSHPAWPSILWQTYDYFFDTNAAYFAAKKAAEPLHIQWNAATDQVEVVNYNASDQKQLTAQAEVLDLDGTLKWQQQATLESREDSTATPIALQFPQGLASTHFLRLKLMKGDQLLSENFYLHATHGEDYTALRSLPKAKVELAPHFAVNNGLITFTAKLKNTSSVPALLVRVKVEQAGSGDQVLPVFFDDNYVALMPGEERTLHGEFDPADAHGHTPQLRLAGFNLE